MRKNRIVLIPLMILGAAAFAFLGGEVVKLLWNWLLPPLFGFKQIVFWQALGLLALCRILVGIGGPRGPHRRFRRPDHDRRWEKLTPEERDVLRKHFADRWNCTPQSPGASS